MSLRDWVAATATVATTATLAAPNLPTVATVASVAVATPASGPAEPATASEAAELRALVRRVLADRPDEWDEAEAVALADPEAALTSFRALAAELPRLPLPDADDCRTCLQCACLSATGRCLAAGRGELLAVASQRYLPVPDLLRRCEGFLPQPADLDQRPGAERWPGLTED